jgi:hypothetical protein
LITFNKPLYVIKLDGKETDHIFAGNVGTISFGETAAIGTEGTDGYVAPTPKYDEIKFTPNIDIGSTDVKYDIILEADTFPKPTALAGTAVHSCIVGSKTVAQITGQTFVAGTSVPFTQEDCYSKPTETDTASVIDFVDAKYTAYIRKTKTGTTENPKYKFATLTRATPPS